VGTGLVRGVAPVVTVHMRGCARRYFLEYSLFGRRTRVPVKGVPTPDQVRREQKEKERRRKEEEAANKNKAFGTQFGFGRPSGFDTPTRDVLGWKGSYRSHKSGSSLMDRINVSSALNASPSPSYVWPLGSVLHATT